jgi:hypothetical protein
MSFNEYYQSVNLTIEGLAETLGRGLITSEMRLISRGQHPKACGGSSSWFVGHSIRGNL